MIAEGFLNSAGLVGNFDPYTYGGTLLVAEGPADSTEFQVVEDIYGWLYSGAQGWGNTWPSEGIGYVFNPVLPTVVSTQPQLTVLTAFPNPASDIVHVQWDGALPADATWFDAQGRRAGTTRLQPGRTTPTPNSTPERTCFACKTALPFGSPFNTDPDTMSRRQDKNLTQVTAFALTFRDGTELTEEGRCISGATSFCLN